MIVVPSVSSGAISSYGVQKKINGSYGASFNFGYNLNYYNQYDPVTAYFYSTVSLYYLKIDNKVIINNSHVYIFNEDNVLVNSYFRNDGYGLGPVGCIDAVNYYLKNVYKINDFTFYPAARYNQYDPLIYLKNSIGRKMILTISSYVYMADDVGVVFDGDIAWTIYVNYPYDEINKTPTIGEQNDYLDPNFNGYITSLTYFYDWINS